MATLRVLERVEVQPIGEGQDASVAAQEWLTSCVASGRAIAVGDVFAVGSREYGVTVCAPGSNGKIAASTEVHVSQQPIPLIKRCQLCFLRQGDPNDNNHTLYDDFIKPQLLTWREDRKKDNGSNFRILLQDRVAMVSGKEFAVRALDPESRCGALHAETEIYVNYVETRSLAKVHVLPYADTLPAAYDFDLFSDFMQPFFRSHPFSTYADGDVFSYNGVRCRLMAVDPPGQAGRICSETVVYCEGEPLRPTVLDVMPRELQQELRRLPRGLQALLLNTLANEEAVQMRLTEVDAVMRPGQGLGSQALAAIPVKAWVIAERRDDTQSQCMVCLADFAEGDMVRDLVCKHVFHQTCIDEWLHRSAACPICKRELGPTTSTASTGSSSRANTTRPSGGYPVAGRVNAPPVPPMPRIDAGNMLESGALLLVGCAVLCDGTPGTIVGIDPPSQSFRVSLEGKADEQLVKENDVVQSETIKIVGLTADADVNGLQADIVGFDVERGRYQVALKNTPQRIISVKLDNCELSTGTVARVTGPSSEASLEMFIGCYGQIASSNGSRYMLRMHPSGHMLSVSPVNIRV